MEGWHDFFVAQAGAAVAFAGLVLVSISINLERIIKAGAIEQPFFRDVMRTPRMKEILKQTYPGVLKLREYAGYTGCEGAKRRKAK